MTYLAAKPRPGREHGIVVGSLDHQVLLALRGPGGMTSDQVYARFTNCPSGALHRLRVAGLIAMPTSGTKGKPISLTDAGKAVIDVNGPLSRRKSLITYCQL
ncbi:MAG: hypothetical protein HYU74_12540 [Dechloromonas sp.]|nr:hypothetical protein [Dechloromonas sp.]